MIGVVAIVFIDDRMHHNRLFVDRQSGIGGNGHPALWSVLATKAEKKSMVGITYLVQMLTAR